MTAQIAVRMHPLVSPPQQCLEFPNTSLILAGLTFLNLNHQSVSANPVQGRREPEGRAGQAGKTKMKDGRSAVPRLTPALRASTLTCPSGMVELYTGLQIKPTISEILGRFRFQSKGALGEIIERAPGLRTRRGKSKNWERSIQETGLYKQVVFTRQVYDIEDFSTCPS